MIGSSLRNALSLRHDGLSEERLQALDQRLSRSGDEIFSESLNQLFEDGAAKLEGREPVDLTRSQPENVLMREIRNERDISRRGQLREFLIGATLSAVWGPEATPLTARVSGVASDLGLDPVDPKALQEQLRGLASRELEAELSRGSSPEWRRFRYKVSELEAELVCLHVWAEIRDRDHRELIRSWRRFEPSGGLRSALKRAPEKIFTRSALAEAASRPGAFALNLWRVGLAEIGAWPTYWLWDDPDAAGLQIIPRPVNQAEVIACSYDAESAREWEETPWWRVSARRKLKRAARSAGVDFAKIRKDALAFSTTELHSREMHRRRMVRVYRYSPRGAERHMPISFEIS